MIATAVARRTLAFNFSVRCFSLAPILRLKEIRESQKGAKTIIEGVRVKSPREGKVVETPKEAHPESCSLCRLNLRRLNYTDVLILSQFTHPDGSLMNCEDTGLCNGKYKLVRKLVAQAHLAQLLPRPPNYEIWGPWQNLKTYQEWPPRYRDQPMRQVKPEYWDKPTGNRDLARL
jgi:ribosomal protein S18